MHVSSDVNMNLSRRCWWWWMSRQWDA